MFSQNNNYQIHLTAHLTDVYAFVDDIDNRHESILKLTTGMSIMFYSFKPGHTHVPWDLSYPSGQ